METIIIITTISLVILGIMLLIYKIACVNIRNSIYMFKDIKYIFLNKAIYIDGSKKTEVCYYMNTLGDKFVRDYNDFLLNFETLKEYNKKNNKK